MILLLKIKNLNYPTLTGLDPFYLLKLVRLLQRKEPFTENSALQQEQIKLSTDDEEAALVDRDKDEITDEKNDTLIESVLGH